MKNMFTMIGIGVAAAALYKLILVERRIDHLEYREDHRELPLKEIQNELERRIRQQGLIRTVSR